MSNSNLTKYIPLLFAFIFTFLFYQQQFGLNLLLAQSILAVYLLLNKQVQLGKNLHTVLFCAFCITAVSSLLIYTALGYFVNWLILMLLVGSLSLRSVKSLPHSFVAFFYSVFTAPIAYCKMFKKKVNGRTNASWKGLKKSVLFIVPLLIISVFMVLYRNSNPKFDRIMSTIFSGIDPVFDWLGQHLNFGLIFTFFVCLFIAIFITVYNRSETLSNSLNTYHDELLRKRKKWPIFKFNGLKNEYVSAVFLFSGLNVLLLVVNIVDIQWVWFDFEWNGEYLKQFVHEGTYLLIFSILLSFALVLYSFRENLNFYSKNSLLKKLSFVWLGQNMILTISVGIRNYHYIQHFALAYKRIAVLFFLLLTLFSLVLVMVKVLKNKSLFFVIRYTSWALFFVLFISALFPWDRIIISYNFEQKNSAFVHFNFLAQMENKNVDLLVKPLPELLQIEDYNATKVGNQSYFMTAENYHSKLEQKKEQFISEWESKNWLSWNYRESQTYQNLMQEN